MHADFWLQRWREGRTGFHHEKTSPLLQANWPKLSLPADSRVLVPLAGKSLDMLWLASQGHRVLGVELSPLAVEQFFTDNNLSAVMRQSGSFKHYTAGSIEMICGDFFDIDDEILVTCSGVYDRAALIALPAAMRQRYAAKLSCALRAPCNMLLVTLDYAQSEMDGPPFAVSSDDVASLYGREWQITQLEQHDILSEQPNFAAQGLSTLQTVVYRLKRTNHAVR
ncbi:MAG TPA: thiopurine S-methyltransferase [Rudaea sp.]|nr:thiopurine S-methyltransferase [Rudaea sp.]